MGSLELGSEWGQGAGAGQGWAPVAEHRSEISTLGGSVRFGMFRSIARQKLVCFQKLLILDRKTFKERVPWAPPGCPMGSNPPLALVAYLEKVS